MSRILVAYATVRLELVIPDEMDDQQVLDEFFESTQVTLEETENIEIQELELLDLSTDSVFDEDIDEDIDELQDFGKGFTGFIS